MDFRVRKKCLKVENWLKYFFLKNIILQLQNGIFTSGIHPILLPVEFFESLMYTFSETKSSPKKDTTHIYIYNIIPSKEISAKFARYQNYCVILEDIFIIPLSWKNKKYQNYWVIPRDFAPLRCVYNTLLSTRLVGKQVTFPILCIKSIGTPTSWSHHLHQH